METSFIPKKNFGKKNSNDSYKNMFLLVAIFIFCFSLVFAIGVFFYKSFLVGEIANKKIILEREKGNMELDLIQKISRFDKRIDITTQLLDKHITLIPLFDFLKDNTLKSIMYDKFSFEKTKGVYYLKLSGKANDYEAVALQADILGKSKDILDPVFSNLGVNNEGNVIFNVEMNFDPRFLSYRDNFKKE